MKTTYETSKDSNVTNMKEELLSNLENPANLEKLYRRNMALFKEAFERVYPHIKGQPAADTWHERLSYKADEIDWGNRRELTFIALAILIAGFIVKIPDLFGNFSF